MNEEQQLSQIAPATALVRAEMADAPSDAEIQSIRTQGAAMVAYKKELNDLYRMIDGMEWGSGNQVVKGSSFSPATRYALAMFCRITGANPLTQVDILGGGPYLNADFWYDKVNRLPHFHHYEQRDLSPSVEEALRKKAEELRELAGQLKETDPGKAAEYSEKAFLKVEEADRVAEHRISWSAPLWAEVVIETAIIRFINEAPLEKIRAGEITDIEPWLITIKECNWAGGRPKEKKKNRQSGQEYEYNPDPVGNNEPAKTARTRSFRRCATRGFSAWGKGYEQQILKAEEAVEAEFDILTEELEEVLPGADEPQAVHTGAGDPSAATEEGAVDLPEEGVEETAAPSTAEKEAPESSWNEADDRKRYFATLRDAGIEDRTAWQKENGLPESTKDWGPDEYQKAFQLLTAGAIKNFEDGCEVLGLNKDEIAHEVIGCLPDSLADYLKLNAHLNSLADTRSAPELPL